MRRRSKLLVPVAVTALTLGMAACDDDDDTTADNDDGEATVEVSDEFCQARVDTEAALSSEDESAVEEALEALDANAPDDLSADVTTIVDALGTDPEGAFENPEVLDALGSLDEAVLDGCGFEVVDVSAVDYEFENLPEEIDAGTVAFRMANDGGELHEIVVVRVNDDVTTSAEELLELPQEEAESMATFVGGAFAPPGGTDVMIGEFEPGRYVAACFIPVGTTEETEGDGPPHFTEGMWAEFTVS